MCNQNSVPLSFPAFATPVTVVQVAKVNKPCSWKINEVIKSLWDGCVETARGIETRCWSCIKEVKDQIARVISKFFQCCSFSEAGSSLAEKQGGADDCCSIGSEGDITPQDKQDQDYDSNIVEEIFNHVKTLLPLLEKEALAFQISDYKDIVAVRELREDLKFKKDVLSLFLKNAKVKSLETDPFDNALEKINMIETQLSASLKTPCNIEKSGLLWKDFQDKLAADPSHLNSRDIKDYIQVLRGFIAINELTPFITGIQDREEKMQELQGLIRLKIIEEKAKELCPLQEMGASIENPSIPMQAPAAYIPQPFENLGNSCYMNSALQALLCVSEFRMLIQSPFPSLEQEIKDLEKASEAMRADAQTKYANNEKRLKEELGDIERALKKGKELKNQQYPARLNVRNALCSLLSVIESPAEDDQRSEKIKKSLENLRDVIFLSGLHCELERGLYEQKDAAVIFEIIMIVFNRYLQKRDVDCATIDNQEISAYRHAVDPIPFIRLSIDHAKVNSFQELVNNEFKLTCNEDAERVFELEDGTVKKASSFFTKPHLMIGPNQPLPNVLVLQLKRFGNNNLVGDDSGSDLSLSSPYKIDTKAPFDDHLIIDMSAAFRSCDLGNQTVKYRLKSFSRHEWGSLNFGHYAARIREGNQWYICNDDDVHPIDISEVRPEMGYIYVFERES